MFFLLHYISLLLRMESSPALLRASFTKSPLPNILSSPFSRSSFSRPRRPTLLPPALLTNPPPWSSGRVPWSTPCFTKWRYLLRASPRLAPKSNSISSMVFSASSFSLSDGLLGFLSLLCWFGRWGTRGFFKWGTLAPCDLIE